jgi:hypothetical protein
MFLQFKLNNFFLKLTYCLIIFLIISCAVKKSYKESYFKEELVLEGNISEAILKTNKKTDWFNENYIKYQADSIIIDSLKQHLTGINFVIFGGTWCSDTKRELPAFLSIIHQLNFGSNQYEIWMLDIKKKSTHINPKLFNIQYVPTILILKEGKEIGRIIEKPMETLELDLLKIISNP